MNKENYIDKNLYENILPVGFFKNGFIRDGNKPANYTYEEYLIEFLNASDYFMNKTNGELFKKSDTGESHGEDDANTKDYCIDFKLILGTSMQYVKDKTSSQIYILEGGGVAYGRSKKEGEYKAIWLHRALRGMNYGNIIKLKEKEIDRKGLFESNNVDRLIENDIHDFLHSIDKDKNILMLYPVCFEYAQEKEVDYNEINRAIYEDFKYILRLRMSYNKETYIAYFYKSSFIISKCEEKCVDFIEAISIKTSETFHWIADFYDLDVVVRNMYK